MIPDEEFPDDPGVRAFEHAAGRVWDALRDLGAAYVVDSKPTDAEEVAAYAGVPPWADLHGCPSHTFIEAVFSPWAAVAVPLTLDLTEHHVEHTSGGAS